MFLSHPTTADCTVRFPAHRVYTAGSWAETWLPQAGIFCDWLYFGCSPQPSRAQLSRNYGYGFPPGQVATFDTWERIDLIDQYVKVEIDQVDSDGVAMEPIVWYGIIGDDGDKQDGAEDGIERGKQTFIARGLETLLDRVYLRSSWVKPTTGAEYEVHRALHFNLDHNYLDPTKTYDERKGERFCNRSTATGDQDVYVFSDSLATAAFWSTLDIVKYLFSYHAPKASDGGTVIHWALSDRTSTMLPTWDNPVIPCDGLTVKAVLDQLCDRRRMLSWRVIPTPDESGMMFDGFTFNDEPLLTPDGQAIASNNSTVSFDLGAAIDVQQYTVQRSSVHRVQQVMCRGARKRSVFSISHADGTLEVDWLPADQTAYQNGPTGLTGNNLQKKLRIEAWRKEDRFRRVFAYFRVPKAWNRTVGDGSGGFTYNPILPVDTAFDVSPSVYMPEAHFQRFLLPGVLMAALDDSPEDAMPAVAWAKMYLGTDGKDRYAQVEKMGEAHKQHVFVEGMPRIDFSCTCRVNPNGLGIIIKATGGRMWGQEAIAKTDFVGVADIDIHTPVIDWQDMIATVMLEVDDRLTAVWPSQSDIESVPLDAARVMAIDLGDKYRLDYVVPGTVKGVSDGELQRFTAAVYLRDDSIKLLDVARMVYEWYRKERKAITLVLRQVTAHEAGVGDLIHTIDNEEINSTVTGLHLDLLGGTTTITTQFAELDPLHL